MHALALLAGLALVLGVLVYLVDRPPGSAWLLPSQWQAAPGGRGWFGAAGLWLPSFVHAFAFSVLSAWLLPQRSAFAAGACLSWALIDTLAECGQHPSLAPLAASAIERAFGHSSAAVQAGRYFTHGSFAVADVAAGLAGSALALLALRGALRHGRRAARGQAVQAAA